MHRFTLRSGKIGNASKLRKKTRAFNVVSLLLSNRIGVGTWIRSRWKRRGRRDLVGEIKG